jgi:hypothetical protein
MTKVANMKNGYLSRSMVAAKHLDDSDSNDDVLPGFEGRKQELIQKF